MYPFCPPGRTPGVLHLPELDAVRLAVADDEDAVVELRAASLLQHTAAVELEGLVVGLDGDADRALADGLHERLLVVGRDVLEAGHGALRDARRAARRRALAVLRSSVHMALSSAYLNP